MRYRAIVGILTLAFALRAALAVYVQDRLDHVWNRDFVIAGDAEGYWELARRITRGEPYALHQPPRQAMRMPGYPVFLASVMMLFGESHFAARLASALAGTCAVGAVYLLGAELLSRRVGLVAAAGMAVSPTAAGFSVVLLSETLFALTLVVSLWLAARLLRSLREDAPLAKSLPWAAAAGLAVTAAAYVRPTWLPATAVFAGLALWAGGLRRGLPVAAVLFAGCMLALLPWAARNHRVTGHWVWTTLWAGPSLYDSLNPNADGSSEMSFFDRDDVMGRGGLSEFEMDRHYRAAAREFIRAQPQQAAALILDHARRYWNPFPNAEQFQSAGLLVAVAASTIPLYLAALAGIAVLRRHGTALLLCAGPILAIGVIHSIFVGSLRYRLPAEYPLAVVAAAGVLAVWDRVSGRLVREEAPA